MPRNARKCNSRMRDSHEPWISPSGTMRCFNCGVELFLDKEQIIATCQSERKALEILDATVAHNGFTVCEHALYIRHGMNRKEVRGIHRVGKRSYKVFSGYLKEVTD